MADINQSMFREYDIRGRVNNQELNKKTMELIGKGFGTYLGRQGVRDMVVGYDFRSYSEELKDALVDGLVSTGVHIIDLGMVLTPMLYYAQYHFGVKGGAMVTASHNPNGWSGVKLASDFSKTLVGDEVKEIYRIIKSKYFRIGQGLVKKDHFRSHIKEVYTEAVIRRVKLEKPLKVVVECGNGTACFFAPEILKKAMSAGGRTGYEIIELFCEPDWTFPHHTPDPESKKAKEALAAKVKEVKADLGISYDGDGDRLGVVDEKGNNVWSDRLLILLARQVLERHPKAKIIFDVKCTQALPEDIKKHNGVPIMWKTGHSHAKRKLEQERATLAGERSGHFFFKDNWYGFDDAIFASLRLIEYLSEQGKSLSRLLKTTPFYDYVISSTIYISCPDNKKFQIVEKLVEEFKKEYGKKNVIDIDGARVKFKDGWGLVRASSTEPALTVLFEAKNQEKLEEIKGIFREKLAKYPEVSKKWKNE